MDEIVVFGLGLIIAAVLGWSFQTLPKERWQILAAVPKEKIQGSYWKGQNLTFYGVFNANAYILATAIVFALLGAVSIPVSYIFVVTISLFAFCIPASRVVAKIVEKKPYTFSVAGAAFVGVITLPWIVWLSRYIIGNWMDLQVQVLVVMAAMSVGYAFGEGVGRLACISFGCCYGKPVSNLPSFWQKLFQKYSFVFTGSTKKVAYAGGLEFENIVPIQAITAVIYCFSGLLGFYLFLKGLFFAAFTETMITTMVWRFLSEFLRADHRGGGKITAYQFMGLLALIYGFIVAGCFPATGVTATNILRGLRSLWNPVVIIFLQGLWGLAFLYTGRSQVTGSNISFHVVESNI